MTLTAGSSVGFCAAAAAGTRIAVSARKLGRIRSPESLFAASVVRRRSVLKPELDRHLGSGRDRLTALNRWEKPPAPDGSERRRIQTRVAAARRDRHIERRALCRDGDPHHHTPLLAA